MADKIYQTEGGSEVGSSLKPMSEGYYLMTAEDIIVPGNKSLKEYIEESGGSIGDSIPIVKVDSTSITLGELITILRNQGVTANDVCLITIGTIYNIFVRISDANTTSNTATIYLWIDLSNPISYNKIMGGLPLSTTIIKIISNATNQLETDSKTVVGAINELNDKISDVSVGDPTTVWLINDEPDLSGLPYTHQSTIPCLFHSNGTYFNGIGKISVGSSSWGINSLNYWKDGTSNGVYTYNPSGSYGISHGWKNEAFKTITIDEKITDGRLFSWLMANAILLSGELAIPCQPALDENLKTQNKTIVGAINEIYESGGSANTDAMPTIRFIGLRGNNLLSNMGRVERSVEFMFEVTSGSLQVDDTLQLCGMRTFGICTKNKVKKRKLRRFAEYRITEEDLNKRILALPVQPTKKAFALLMNKNHTAGGAGVYYFRIRRPVGAEQNNASMMSVDARFSNVIPVNMLNLVTDTEEDIDGDVVTILRELKINIV